MATKRRGFSAQFNFKVALEAVKGVKTLSELASEHGVHPNQIGQWKQQLLKEGRRFSAITPRTNKTAREEARISRAKGEISREMAIRTIAVFKMRMFSRTGL